jgi:hypothetical protein
VSGAGPEDTGWGFRGAAGEGSALDGGVEGRATGKVRTLDGSVRVKAAGEVRTPGAGAG